MAALIAFGLFGFLMLAISYAGYRYYARPGRYYEQLGGGPPLRDGAMAEHREGLGFRIVREIGKAVPVSPQDVSVTRRYLIAAGFRSEGAIGFFYGTKIIGAVALVATAIATRDLITSARILQIVLVIGAGLAGYFGPGLILDWLVSRRQERLRLSLPDALDLMIVCVEAGLGLDQAIVNVSRELKPTHRDISDEFGLVTLEMQSGKWRAEALHNLAERTGVDEIRKLVAILIQTDRFGTSMGDSLRTHSDYLRVRRRQEAEERAGKVGVKLVFPIFFCILPAMFVVVAGPGFLQVLKQLFPMMKQYGQ